jgi:hypothetical protein
VAHLIDNPAVADRLARTGRAHLGEELSPAALGAVLDDTYGPGPDRENATPHPELKVLAS